MNKLEKMIADGTITVEDLENASELLEIAKLVKTGLKACRKKIVLPLGAEKVECYSPNYSTEYEAWGECLKDGTLILYSNWGENHELGRCNLLSFRNTFESMMQKDDFSSELKRFLQEQIDLKG